MFTDWENLEEDDEELDESESEKSIFTSGRDATIFLVDATASMFQGSENPEENPFHLCIKCARNTLANKIISSDKDLLGLVLFGTDKHKNSSDFKHIYIWQPLEPPSDKAILGVEALMEMTSEKFQDEFGHNTAFSLSDALWTCSMMFNNCNYKLAHQEVLIFTATDRPHAGQPALERQALDKARDLADHGINIDLIPLIKKEKGSGDAHHTFNTAPFYKDIIFQPEGEVIHHNTCSKLEELLARIHCKQFKKRPLSTLKMKIATGLQLSLQVFALVKEAKKPFSIRLDKASNAPLQSSTQYFLEETGELLLPTDMKKCFSFAGKDIYMDPDEVKQIRALYEQGLVLLGFKPRSSLKIHHFVRPSLFVYPTENLITGSTKLFTGLLHACLKRDKIMICRLTQRKFDPPHLVALVPQAEEKDEQDVQTFPPGFHLVFLPFADDFRTFELKNKINPPLELVDKAKEIIRKLKFTFNPENIENPVLQKHWRSVEALALNRSEPDEMVDHTMPDNVMIRKKVGTLIEDFKKEAFGNSYAEVGAEKKKSASKASGTQNPSKRAKLEEGTIDVKKEAEAKQLGQLTVAVLREFCKREGIKTSSKKSEIIDAIYSHLKIF